MELYQKRLNNNIFKNLKILLIPKKNISIMHLIVLRGLPGSGKTTFSNKILEEYPDGKVISNDLLRSENNSYNYDYNNNNYIYKENYKLLIDYLNTNIKVIIIDNCNINRDLLDLYYSLSIKYNYKYFQLAFPKPIKKNMYTNFLRCKNKIHILKYQKIWLNYHKHNLDKDVNSIELRDITTIK